MTSKPLAHFNNELLIRMSVDDLDLINPYFERCTLPLRTDLEPSNGLTEFVYFLEGGIASVVASLPEGRDTEIGLIGREGMTGTSVVLGDDQSAHHCYVQLPAEAIRIPAHALTKALNESPTLRIFLLKYVNALYIQTGFTALINARSKLESRMARWLLMCADRVQNEQLTITHDFLSIMLGVRRPGVTVGIQVLEGKGLIRAARGSLILRDRQGLIDLTEGGYGQPEAEYERLLGPIGGGVR